MNIHELQVGNVVLNCAVCEKSNEFYNGLQGFRCLSDDQGMFFPYDGQTATFHMGTVSFPIDIVFTQRGRISKIIRNVQPGTLGQWSSRNCSGVLEVRGVWCADYNVDIGTRMRWL